MNYLIEHYGIKKGDKVSRLKRGVFFIRHYAVYLGTDIQGKHLFAENNLEKGVQIITSDEFFRDSNAIKVESTSKDILQREKAVNFALGKVGKKYDLINYNCEHFANEVTKGTAISTQVSWGIGLTFLVIGGVLVKNFKN